MEVPGRVDRVTKNTSDEGDTVLCDACRYGGINSPASCYCSNCQEYLCRSCDFHHRNIKITRGHVMLDMSLMPDPATRRHIPSSVCKQHSGGFLEFFCKMHNDLACYICVSVKHKQCDLNYIPYLAKDFTKGQEFISFEQNADDLNDTVDAFLANNTTELADLQAMHDTATELIKQTRAKLETYFHA